MLRPLGSIRKKIQLIVLLLLLLLGTLAGTGICAVRLYRDSVLFVNHRSLELPVAFELSSQISQMRRQIESLKWIHKDRETFLNDHRRRPSSYDGSETVLFGRNLLGQSLKESFSRNLETLRNLERACDRMLHEGQTEVPEHRREEYRMLREIAILLEKLEQRSDHSIWTTWERSTCWAGNWRK